MLEPGDIFEAVIRGVAFGGDGVAAIDGEVCFIPGVLPGEKIRAKLDSRKKNFCRAVPLEILEPSPDRIEPRCPLAFRPYGRGRGIPDACPGCAYQHTTYENEVKLKQQQLEDLFIRTAGLENAPFAPPIAAPNDYGYRNKLTFHVHLDEGRVHLGYYMSNNHSILEIKNCPLANEKINTLLSEVRETPGFFHTLHREMEVTFRYTEKSGAMYWRNNPSSKLSWLKEDSSIGEISVPAGSFYQINPDCGNVLIDKVSELVKAIKPETFIDLYCGVGIFGATAAVNNVKKIIGVDVDGPAIKTAEYNLQRYGATDFKLIAGKADKVLKGLKGQYDPSNTMLVVDPPRTGLELSTLQHTTTTNISNIIYISCGADTLCRDMRRLLRAGYKVRSVQLVDMFPRTAHFESITWLEK